MDDTMALIIENAQLKMKVEMLEKMMDKVLEQANAFNAKIDENLKLSIQSSGGMGRGKTVGAEWRLEKELHTTIAKNLGALDESRLVELLEVDPPAIGGLVEIFDKAVRGPHSEGHCLAKFTSKQYCKFIDGDGREKVQPINVVFDDICAAIYARCSSAISSLIEENPDDMNEVVYKKSSNRYTNAMAFNDAAVKKRLLKEVAVMFA